MIRLAAPFLLALPAWAEPTLPSGLAATAHDVLEEAHAGGETWLVLRYLAPGIGTGAHRYEDVIADLDHLCATDGLTRAAAMDPAAAQIVVVLMDRAVPRGQRDPEATQFIAAYLPDGEECLWN